MLDLAAGAGRHTRLLLDMGFSVTAIDRDITALRLLAGERCDIRALDLESGAAWPLGWRGRWQFLRKYYLAMPFRRMREVLRRMRAQIALKRRSTGDES